MKKNEHNYQFYAYLGAVFTIGLILVFGLISAFQPGQMWASARAYEHEAIERGTETYAHDCATCHGAHGEGVRNTGPALNTKEFLEAASDELLFNTITDGRPGTAMPAWGQARGGPYNAQVVEDLVATIRSWEATAPSVAEMVYEGDPVQGAVLFSTTCYACHGVSGEGRAGPALNDADLLARVDDDYFRQAIKDGRPEQGMPTWGSVLSPAQVEDLVAYIQSWQNEPPVAMASLGGDTNRGRSIFNSTCTICHGPNGSGTDIAPPLADSQILADADAVYATISDGRLDEGMPSWGQVLSPAEINDVIAYLNNPAALSTSEDNAKPAVEQDTPTFDEGKAQLLFIQQCAPCHGATGEGQNDIPGLVSNEFIQTNDDEALIDFILTGRPGTAMVGFAERLSEEEIDLAIQLIRTWQ